MLTKGVIAICVFANLVRMGVCSDEAYSHAEYDTVAGTINRIYKILEFPESRLHDLHWNTSFLLDAPETVYLICELQQLAHQQNFKFSFPDAPYAVLRHAYFGPAVAQLSNEAWNFLDLAKNNLGLIRTLMKTVPANVRDALAVITDTPVANAARMIDRTASSIASVFQTSVTLARDTANAAKRLHMLTGETQEAVAGSKYANDGNLRHPVSLNAGRRIGDAVSKGLDVIGKAITVSAEIQHHLAHLTLIFGNVARMAEHSVEGPLGLIKKGAEIFAKEVSINDPKMRKIIIRSILKPLRADAQTLAVVSILLETICSSYVNVSRDHLLPLVAIAKNMKDGDGYEANLLAARNLVLQAEKDIVGMMKSGKANLQGTVDIEIANIDRTLARAGNHTDENGGSLVADGVFRSNANGTMPSTESDCLTL